MTRLTVASPLIAERKELLRGPLTGTTVRAITEKRLAVGADIP
jgi:hypothetical protein